MERRFKTLDEALEHIKQVRGAVEPRANAEEKLETESRWWSYTGKQNIDGQPAPGNEAAEHYAPDYVIKSDNGVYYQKCGGGRRVIHKRIGGN